MHGNTLDPLELLEYRPVTGRRAIFEDFELHPIGDGDIEVVNTSYGPDARGEHSHTVHVVSGIPSDCTCRAWQYHTGACKHMVRVALAPSVIEAASSEDHDDEPPLLADGGIVEASSESEALDEWECEACAELPGAYPCATCYIAGRKPWPEADG